MSLLKYLIPNNQKTINPKGFGSKIVTQSDRKYQQQKLEEIRNKRVELTKEIFDINDGRRKPELDERVRKLLKEAYELDPEFHKKRRNPYSVIKTYWHCYKAPHFQDIEIPYSEKFLFLKRLCGLDSLIGDWVNKELKTIKNYKFEDDIEEDKYIINIKSMGEHTTPITQYIQQALIDYIDSYQTALTREAFRKGLMPREEYFERVRPKKYSTRLYHYCFTFVEKCPFARYIFQEALEEVLTDEDFELLKKDKVEFKEKIRNDDGVNIITKWTRDVSMVGKIIKQIGDDTTEKVKEIYELILNRKTSRDLLAQLA